jgi:murein DD-endopeptidase MepM/ murein hydrolase activator NlpD
MAGIAAIMLVVLAGSSPALAQTALQRSRRALAATVREIAHLRRDLEHAERVVERRVPLSGVLFARSGPALDADRADAIRERGRANQQQRLELDERWRRSTLRRISMLQDRRGALQNWLGTYGVFEVCPVSGFTMIHDDFGLMVRLPKVPVHRHMGADISAPTWAPIRAPFDGYARGSASHLGGLEVRITGARGYIYNAHLISYGRLGWVRTGDVIGYVGSTGDATGPHDHLEWHPWGGSAVDPFPYLAAACLAV